MSMSESDLDALQQFVDMEFNDGLETDPLVADVEPAAAPAEPVTPVLTYDDDGRARGPDGRYVSTAEPEETDSAEEEIPADVGIEPQAEEPEAVASDEVPEVVPADADEDEFLEIDPETLGIGEDHLLFTKYGGDLTKALEALEESQRYIAERPNEARALREENEQLKQIAAQMADMDRRIQASQVDWDEAIFTNAKDAADLAVQLGNGEAFNQALRAWAEDDPIAPMMYLQELQQELAELEAQPAEPDSTLEAEVNAFKERNPDFQALLPAIEEIASQRPILQRALSEGTAQERAQALDDLYSLAKSRSVATDTSAATRRVILRAKAEADQAKNDAVVVGASRTSAVTTEEPLTGSGLLQQALREISGLDDLVVVD